MRKIVEVWANDVFQRVAPVPSGKMNLSGEFEEQAAPDFLTRTHDSSPDCSEDESVGDPDDLEAMAVTVRWDAERVDDMNVRKPLEFAPKLPPWPCSKVVESMHPKKGIAWIVERAELWSMSTPERHALLEHWLNCETSEIEGKMCPILEGYQIAGESGEIASRRRHANVLTGINLVVCTISGWEYSTSLFLSISVSVYFCDQ